MFVVLCIHACCLINNTCYFFVTSKSFAFFCLTSILQVTNRVLRSKVSSNKTENKIRMDKQNEVDLMVKNEWICIGSQ